MVARLKEVGLRAQHGILCLFTYFVIVLYWALDMVPSFTEAVLQIEAVLWLEAVFQIEAVLRLEAVFQTEAVFQIEAVFKTFTDSLLQRCFKMLLCFRWWQWQWPGCRGARKEELSESSLCQLWQFLPTSSNYWYKSSAHFSQVKKINKLWFLNPRPCIDLTGENGCWTEEDWQIKTQPPSTVKVDAYDIDHLMLRAPVNQFGLVVMAQSLWCGRSAGCRFESVLQFTFLQILQHMNAA